MATFANIQNRVEGYLAGADLSAKQYTFVTSDGDEVTTTGAGEAATGVLWNDPESGRAASVVRGGEPMVYAGAAIAVGAEIASDADGKAVTAVSTDVILGVARTAATAEDELVTITFYGPSQTVKA
jgi:hypothetical protein